MEKLIFNNVEEIRGAYNTGDPEKDLNVVNAVLSGDVEIKKEDNVVESVEVKSNDGTTEQHVDDKENTQPTNGDTSNEEVEDTVPIDSFQDEIKRQQRYHNMLLRQKADEKEELLKKNKEIEDRLIQEQKNREELEKRLRELEQLKDQLNNSSQSNSESEEEEFISDYNRKTRQLVEQLKHSIGEHDPKIEELSKEIDHVKVEYEKEAAKRKHQQELEIAKKKQEQVYDNIRGFLIKHPELKPEKDLAEIDEDYKRFRQDIAYISGVQSLEDLEKAIDDYRQGGKIKELADKNGIKPIKDLQKYDEIVELIDFQAGLRYDAALGKIVPVLDESGVRVRYGSLEEAYNIKNYYKNLTDIKRQAYKDVSSKLEQFNDAPVVLQDSQTDSFNTGLTLEQEKEIINMNPREWYNNPEKKRLVEVVYSKYNLEIPKYRGKN